MLIVVSRYSTLIPHCFKQGAFTYEEEGGRQDQGARKGEVGCHEGRSGEGPRPRQEPQTPQRLHREQQVGTFSPMSVGTRDDMWRLDRDKTPLYVSFY